MHFDGFNFLTGRRRSKNADVNKVKSLIISPSGNKENYYLHNGNSPLEHKLKQFELKGFPLHH